MTGSSRIDILIICYQRSCSVSNLLLEDFEAAQGYSVMATFLAYLDRLVENCLAAADTTAGGAETTESGDDNAPQLQDNAEKKEADAQLAVAMKVIESIGDFVWVGSQPMDLPEEDLLVYSPYNEGNLPPPASAAGDKGKEGCIRNLEAFKILQNFVLEVRPPHALITIMFFTLIAISPGEEYDFETKVHRCNAGHTLSKPGQLVDRAVDPASGPSYRTNGLDGHIRTASAGAPACLHCHGSQFCALSRARKVPS